MIAEVVAIGDELLHGALLDTNSKYVAGRLEQVGAVVHRFTVVGDEPGALEAVLAEACARADVVVTTGGLGPTLDDRTRDVAAQLCGFVDWNGNGNFADTVGGTPESASMRLKKVAAMIRNRTETVI